jgi:hypothetical protein
MGKAGVRDPFAKEKSRPLAEHLADYRRELEARGNDPRYVELTVARVRALLDGCGFVFTSDLSASCDGLAGRAAGEGRAVSPSNRARTCSRRRRWRQSWE